ncbi:MULTISPECIES: TonB-dependent receptor domain-containing protein [Methylotenera]|uniref:TonB-dependent receptor domain-containing protein n=1 Tax=Methylotenera TaxID=359407 RepID=UPI00037ED46F|nr:MULTISPECIES: TonB-dependent receptor [Methylotenera]
MSFKQSQNSDSPPANRLPFRPSKVTIAIATALSIFSANPVYAADDKVVDELQAEITRLKQALQKSEQELAAQKNTAAPASNETAAGAAPAGNATENNTAAAPPPEEANNLDAVVVRSRSKLEKLHDVPQSASVLSGAELNRELALDLGSITRRTAGIQFNQNNTRGGSLSIRGLGKRSFTETQDPSVGLDVDGVSYGLTQLGNFDFFDVESVTVLRGPQGTAGGKGGSTGLVSINTRRPSFVPTADFSLTYGQRDALVAKANLGGTVVEDLLAWRGSFIADRGRGFYDSEYDKNYSFYNRNRLAGRAQFLLTPTPELTARFSFDLEPKAPQVENGLTFRHDQPLKYDNGLYSDPRGTTAKAKLAGYIRPTVATNPNSPTTFVGARDWFVGRSFSADGRTNKIYDYNDYVSKKLLQNENQGQTVTNKGASAEVNYDFENNTLTSITAWRSYSFDAHNDEGTPFDINLNGGGGVDYRQYSQEFRIDSKPGELFDYRAGIYALRTEDTISSKTGWGADAGAWFANEAQYNALDRNAGVNRGSGLALLKDSLDDGYTKADTKVDTNSNAVYGQINWHLTEDVNLLTGLRITHEDRTTEDTKILASNGIGAALNPVSVRGVATGGFASDGSGNLGANTPAQLAMADAVAAKYFGAANYGALSTDQKLQIANAKTLRAGQIGTLSNGVKSSYRDVLFTSLVSPSYKINENFTAYTSWQYGEKSGSALNVNFVKANVKPEKTNAFELGLKSELLDKTLTLNADVYYQDIRDYQSTIRAVDEFTTATNIATNQPNPLAYLSVQGNVKRVKAKGFELDAFYSGIDYTTVRFGLAYTDARYADFDNAAKPDELTYLAPNFISQTGDTLPGVSKWTFNLGAEYRRPIVDKIFHTSFNTNFNSRYNNTDTLSSYGWVDAYSRTDASIGLTFKNNFDLSLVGRNIFDNREHEEGWTSYAPFPYPRWIGVSFSGKL